MSTAPCTLPESDSELLARALAGAEPGPRGLFPDGSWLRRVSGEGAALFGGACALLLEVAHPLVAEGVANHSRYREDPLGRLGRTLAAMNAMAFGSVPEALAAARSVEAAHARVRGQLATPTGAFTAGTPYDGRDPDLVRWVWATLAWTAREVYLRVAGPLSDEALSDYHREHGILARLIGVPAEAVPDTPDAFASYFDQTVAETLAVGATARDIAGFILDPPPAMRALGIGRARALAAALLPEPVREGFGLPWDAAREARLEDWLASVRAMRAAGTSLDAPGPSR